MEYTVAKAKWRMMINILTVISMIAIIGFCIYGWQMGLFTDKTKLEAMIHSTGLFGPLLFVIIQIIQVVIPIIPGGVSCAAGVIFFGPWYGLLYNYIGIVIGSMINFFLARQYGQTFVKYFVKEETYEKYVGWLEKGKKFDKFFALAIFFPCAPDDFLCMLAGLTKMTWKKFTTIIVFGKPASIALYSLALVYAGSFIGKLIA